MYRKKRFHPFCYILTASSIASFGTGFYVGYQHAVSGGLNLVYPLISTGLEAFLFRDQTNIKRKNPVARLHSKSVMTSIGAGIGAFLNFAGYGAGYGVGFFAEKVI